MTELHNRIAAAEQDLAERVAVSQSLYGGGMEVSRREAPPAPTPRALSAFSTQEDLKSERMLLDEQLEKCRALHQVTGQTEPRDGKSGTDWSRIVTPASAWELNRNLNTAAEAVQEARARSRDLERAVAEEVLWCAWFSCA